MLNGGSRARSRLYTMKLRLNLATSPLENKRPFLAASGFMGAVGILLLLFLSHGAYKAWRGDADRCGGRPRFASRSNSYKKPATESAALFRVGTNTASSAPSRFFEFAYRPTKLSVDQDFYGP